MRTSDRGLLEIAEHEGIVPAPYKDSVGVWTYGIGHTASAGGLDPREMNSAMPIDLDAAVTRCVELFREDVRKYEDRVNRAFTVPLEQHQFDALVSWDFNTGGATWRSKTTRRPCQLVQQVNSGNLSGDGFMGWLKPPEIRKRRTAEQRLFKTGDYDHNGDSIPIWQTDGRGNLRGVLRVMHGAELLDRMNRIRSDWAPDPQEQPPGGLAGLLAFLRNLFGGTK